MEHLHLELLELQERECILLQHFNDSTIFVKNSEEGYGRLCWCIQAKLSLVACFFSNQLKNKTKKYCADHVGNKH